MTAPAIIKAADLKRMAKVAKANNVSVWIEIDGKRIGVSPEMPAVQGTKPLAKYEDFDL
ncbi:hypothetical protein [Rhizobium arsenicireducens]